MDGAKLVLGDPVRPAEIVRLGLLGRIGLGGRIPEVAKYAVDLFLGESAGSNDFPEKGLSLVTIEDVQYSGYANLSTDTTEHFIFNSIVLDIDDSTRIKILREKFLS